MSSSLLPISSTHVAADPDSAYIADEPTELIRLDAIPLPPARNIWLKVDTQGSERSAIEGAAGILDRVRVIQLELSLVSLYEDDHVLEDSIRDLRYLGFVPVYLQQGFTEPTTNEVLQVDGLFRRVRQRDEHQEVGSATT